MRTATGFLLAGVALARVGTCSPDITNSLVAPTIETNSIGVATGMVTSVTSALANGTTVLPTSVFNGTATSRMNGTGITSGGAQPTGSASVSGGSGSTGGAAVVKPMVGIGAAGVALALFL